MEPHNRVALIDDLLIDLQSIEPMRARCIVQLPNQRLDLRIAGVVLGHQREA
jgi:hypothetical protein